MTTEQFEQAKREFAKTYGGSIVVGFGQPSGSGGRSIETAEEQCLSDLNSLLEQHKEVMKEELRQKLLSMRSTKEAMDKLDADDKLMQYGYHDCITVDARQKL